MADTSLTIPHLEILRGFPVAEDRRRMLILSSRSSMLVTVP